MFGSSRAQLFLRKDMAPGTQLVESISPRPGEVEILPGREAVEELPSGGFSCSQGTAHGKEAPTATLGDETCRSHTQDVKDTSEGQKCSASRASDNTAEDKTASESHVDNADPATDAIAEADGRDGDGAEHNVGPPCNTGPQLLENRALSQNGVDPVCWNWKRGKCHAKHCKWLHGPEPKISVAYLCNADENGEGLAEKLSTGIRRGWTGMRDAKPMLTWEENPRPPQTEFGHSKALRIEALEAVAEELRSLTLEVDTFKGEMAELERCDRRRDRQQEILHDLFHKAAASASGEGHASAAGDMSGAVEVEPDQNWSSEICCHHRGSAGSGVQADPWINRHDSRNCVKQDSGPWCAEGQLCELGGGTEKCRPHEGGREQAWWSGSELDGEGERDQWCEDGWRRDNEWGDNGKERGKGDWQHGSDWRSADGREAGHWSPAGWGGRSQRRRAGGGGRAGPPGRR